MAFSENFTDFINEDTPGYCTVDFNGHSFGGIFTDDYQQVFQVEGSEPKLLCVQQDAVGIVIGSTLQITHILATESLIAKSVNPDGMGMLLIELERIDA